MTVSAMAKSWKHCRFSPCERKDTASSCCKLWPYRSSQSVLAKWMHWCMPTCRCENAIILHCNQNPHSYHLALRSSEAGKSRDHDDCGFALRHVQSCLIIWVLSHGSDVKSLDRYLRETFDRMWDSSSAVYFLQELGAKSMHVHRCAASMQVGADGHAQMADHLCYYGAIAEAHDRDGCVHLW